jgi:hypothetical protein
MERKMLKMKHIKLLTETYSVHYMAEENCVDYAWAKW